MRTETEVLDRLFLEARSQNGWAADMVDDALLKDIYDVCKMGPTSMNSSPARFVFVRSNEAKSRLEPAIFAGNKNKVMTAPVTVIAAYDAEFYEALPQLFPHKDARAHFVGKDDYIAETAFRNATLQAGYFLVTARAFGLDVGPISGFDNAMVDEAFFKGTAWRSNFLMCLGKGDSDKTFERLPRLAFDEACKLA